MVNIAHLNTKIVLAIFCINLILLGFFLGNLELIGSLLSHPVVNKPYTGHFNLSCLRTYYQLKYGFHEMTGLETHLQHINMQEACYRRMWDDLSPEERKDPYILNYYESIKPKINWRFAMEMGAAVSAAALLAVAFYLFSYGIIGMEYRVWKIAEAWCGHDLKDIYSVAIVMSDAFWTSMFTQRTAPVNMARLEFLCEYYWVFTSHFNMMDLRDYITSLPYWTLTPEEHKLIPYDKFWWVRPYLPMKYNKWGPPAIIDLTHLG